MLFSKELIRALVSMTPENAHEFLTTVELMLASSEKIPLDGSITFDFAGEEGNEPSQE